jgi:hypothetical protein
MASCFLAREHPHGIIISPPAAHHRDLVSALSQPRSHIAQVLRRRDDIGIKRLIEEENF